MIELKKNEEPGNHPGAWPAGDHPADRSFPGCTPYGIDTLRAEIKPRTEVRL